MENYVFPRFEQAGKRLDLVRTLRAQHEAGRTITTRIRGLTATGAVGGSVTRELNGLIGSFVRMYRPDAAREDTVLFREYPDIVGAEEYRELGETFEKQEHKLFGEGGFTTIVDKVAAIEQHLGIYDLARFTPR